MSKPSHSYGRRQLQDTPRRKKSRFRFKIPLLCLIFLCCGCILGWSAQYISIPDDETTGPSAGISDEIPENTGEIPETAPIAPVASETPSQPEPETSGGMTQPPTAPVESSPPPSDQVSEDDWMLQLINWENPLPEDFQAPELTELKNNQAIDSRVYPELQEMMDDARAAGYEPLICSSFRTWDKQAQLYERKVQFYMDQGSDRDTAESQAAVWVARPGTSEHQAGLAVDIVSVDYQILDEGQEDTPLQQWLMEHCWEYGFILRYPTDKSDLTGVGYEPWHYRYVGKEAAQAITEQGICLEEYLAQADSAA